jgi:predicted anti-sigma-YlaC factor YlaD
MAFVGDHGYVGGSDVGCAQCREALSARLDGEDDAGERAEVDAHLAGCAECARWLERASVVNRMARMSTVAPGPGISDEVLAAAPGRGRRRLADGLRVLLGALGFAQFALGMAQLTAISAIHDHLGLSGAPDSSHLWHESAAWNVAIGAGFGWIAIRRTRPAGLMPLMTAFVVLLTLVSVGDLWQGQVDRTRLMSHIMVVLGYLVLLALGRPELDFSDPPHSRLSRPGWRVRFEDPEQATSRLRDAVRNLPAQSARHDEAA